MFWILLKVMLDTRDLIALANVGRHLTASAIGKQTHSNPAGFLNEVTGGTRIHVSYDLGEEVMRDLFGLRQFHDFFEQTSDPFLVMQGLWPKTLDTKLSDMFLPAISLGSQVVEWIRHMCVPD